MVQELGENCSARVHSSFSHPGLLLQAGPFRTYLTSNQKKLKSHLIPFLPVHWGTPVVVFRTVLIMAKSKPLSQPKQLSKNC